MIEKRGFRKLGGQSALSSAAAVLVVFLMSSICPVVAAAETVCGPGAHWVDSCVAATQTWAIRLEFGIDGNFDGVTDADAAFEGFAVVQNDAPVESNPSGDPGHLDLMSSQIINLSLAGTSANVAGWTFRAGVGQGLSATTGFIQEDGSNAALAENRYDMVFAIDGTPFGTLHHVGTFFFTDLISAFPQPGADYRHLGGPFGTSFELYDVNDALALVVTDLLQSDHIGTGRPHFVVTAVVPVPATIWLFASGLGCVTWTAARRTRRDRS